MDRFKIIIVDRVQQCRFPRSKKRRIRKKWEAREENYRPMMVPVGRRMMMGAEALRIDPATGERRTDEEIDALYLQISEQEARVFEMSTDLWCMAAGLHPEWAEKCDLFYRGYVGDDDLMMIDDIPLPTDQPFTTVT